MIPFSAKILGWSLALLVALVAGGIPVTVTAQATEKSAPQFVPDEIIVTYRSGVTADEIVLLEARYHLTLKRAFPEIRARHYTLPSGSDVTATVDALSTEAIVEAAEPNLYLKLNATPTDPRFGEQWALLNTGQVVNGVAGTSGVDIRWTQAMDVFTGATPVTVALVDSGVALDHPDIAPNLWINPAEVVNGIDDDGNGYVDDVNGWDFISRDGSPFDVLGHGTLGASLIGSAMDNGVGGAGVAPIARLMPLRAAGFAIGLTATATIEALQYAAMNGARIVNFSAGSPNYSTALFNSIRDLDRKGVLVVAAAANEGTNNDMSPYYPASFNLPNVISVAAIDQSGNLASFSNYGAASVHLAAPGTNIFGAGVRRSQHSLETFEGGLGVWTVGQLAGSRSTLNWGIFLDPYGNRWLTDSLDALGQDIPYQPYTDSAAASPAIVLANIVGPVLRLRTWFSLESGYDGVLVEVSADDGSSWAPIALVSGSSGGVAPWAGTPAGFIGVIDLTQFEGRTIRLRFRLISDGSINLSGAFFDDLEITKVETYLYDGTQYQFGDGTSFSAPLTTGVAALLMSQRPDLGHRKIKQIIVDSVNKSPALSGKVLSAGMLDANAAVLAAKAEPAPPPPTTVYSAVLPASRSVPVGGVATAFATIINSGATPAEGCAVTPADALAGRFVFQTTDPATNALTGTPNTPIDVAPGAAQSFVFAFSPSAPFSPSEFKLDFSCFNAPPAGVTIGLNTLLISASSIPTPDVVALGATLTNDGIVNIPGVSGAGAFAVASVNVGAGSAITVGVDTGSTALPLSLSLCETNPGTGQCLQAPAGSVATAIANGATPTFGIFVSGTGSAVAFNPAVNRVFVRFREGGIGGTVRGATSVAVRTR